MFSVIIYGRNDSHGYNLHKRAAISLNELAEVMIRDHQLHARESTRAQALEERGPERAVFGVADLDAQDFPVAGGGHAGGDDQPPGRRPGP